MNQSEVEAFVEGFDNVQRTEKFGYIFYFVGDDHFVPFMTLANSDDDFDNVSNLNRDGVFRINIGVSRETFHTLLGEAAAETADYSAINVFLPHPHYAQQNFICILNPSGENVAKTKELITEAYDRAAARFARKRTNRE